MKNRPFRFYCHEMQEIRQCCSSCHNEWDDGYGYPIELEVGKKTILEMCCGAYEELEDKNRIVLLIKAARKDRR